MPVRDVWAGDVALVELARSERTEAPAEVLSELARRGHVKLSGKTAKLTGAGRIRANALAKAEGNIRAMAANTKAGLCAIMTAAGPRLTSR
ncbi:MAG: hypothetical protein C0467_07080 [Planctomycetaceae bacterium]|nr:hypothetical protein [Planctomycetaceae bacterium]